MKLPVTDIGAHNVKKCLTALDKKKLCKSHYVKKKNDEKKINKYNFNGVLCNSPNNLIDRN